ncbi:MAG: HTH domain-containing protein [Candidatus Promineifilaceae bacterium]
MALANACFTLAVQYPELEAEFADQQLQIIYFARQHQTVTTTQLAQFIQVSNATIHRYIKAILKAGILNKNGNGSATAYQQDVSEGVVAFQAGDRWTLAHASFA